MSLCEWALNGDGDYDTGCKNRFQFIDAGPTENHFQFCPYCGKEIESLPLLAACAEPTLKELADSYAVAYSQFVLDGAKDNSECVEAEKALHTEIYAAIRRGLIKEE